MTALPGAFLVYTLGVRTRLRAILAALVRLDPAVYTLWAATWTILSARLFYGYMMRQTGGEWSAPLDDVFIHFDYARATAQGHPFEWVAGNGYSSGNTSLTYPLVLALGWLSGFRDTWLMKWAAIVAMVCVFGTLLATRKLFVSMEPRSGPAAGRWRPMALGSYLLPPLLLGGVGALPWSLWSGMEVAWLLGVWACALLAFLHLDRAPADRIGPRAWWLGFWGVVLVATRPEAASTLAAFGVAAALRWRGRALGVLVRVGAPAAFVLVLQAIANRTLTGEWSANGALVKLALHNPFLKPDEKFADYVFNLRYAVLRNTEYHFADSPVVGSILPALALAAVAVKGTRRIALVLWAQIAGWLALVALNGQVRWQNERYTMPAVAWLMVCAALGVTALVRRRGKPDLVLATLAGALVAQSVATALRPGGTDPELRLSWAVALVLGLVCAVVLRPWVVRAPAALLVLILAQQHQESRLRDQKWFFGRACRNIRDAHGSAGRWLAAHDPKRVLVGDAGALMYESGRPGLDIIGLGGYGDLPFARAGVHGLPATIELIERIPPEDRPDVFAIFPTWWGVLPVWFSKRVLARFPAPGNVICGGYEDVVYEADWSLLGTGDAPRAAHRGRVVDTVDVADLVSERRHRYAAPLPAGGWTEMKILADPGEARKDMFDAGRRTGRGQVERFSLWPSNPGSPADLIVRGAPWEPAHVTVRVGGAEVGRIDWEPGETWVESVVPLPTGSIGPVVEIELLCGGPGDCVHFHAWLTQ